MTAFNRLPLRTEDGIARFSGSDFYWSLTIPRENLRALVPLVGRMPLPDACRAAQVEPNYIIGYYRSDFMYQLPYKKGFRVLDLGSGFGNITVPLARRMPDAEIYAADGSFDILRLLAARARAEGCTNIVPLQTETFEHGNLPFAPGTFDLILMNGVLEWIGSGVSEGDPEQWQRDVLRYLKTLLRPGGALYIGIEARYFLGYFMGIRDPHSRMRFTSVVPRALAHRLLRLGGKPEGYRTYTHSYRGYLRLLRQAGFAAVRTIYSIASYKDPYYLFFVDEPESYRFAFTKLRHAMFPRFRGRFAYRLFYWLGLERFFAPGFLFLAYSEGDRSPSLLAAYLDPLLDDSKTGDYEILKIDGNKGDEGCVNFLLLPRGASLPRYFAKVKRTGTFTQAHTEALARARKTVADALLLPVSGSDTAELYSYADLKAAPPSWVAVCACAALARKLHAAGLVHGDLTLENFGEVAGTKILFDLEALAQGGAWTDDLASLVLHYFLYLKHLRGTALRDALLAPRTRALFKECGVNGDVRELLREYVARSAACYARTRPLKYALYRELFATF